MTRLPTSATSRTPAVTARVAALIVLLGFLTATGARVLDPGAPPLYDGVLPLVPYVYLDPPSGEPSGPRGAMATVAVTDSQNALVSVATDELQPQAQLLAAPGDLVVAPGATSLDVSIEPVRPTTSPANGHIDGNVYRITVRDNAGNPVLGKAGGNVSVVLRSTDPNQATATIARFGNGSWEELETAPTGVGGSFLVVVTSFGDFAVILPGPAGGGAGDAGPVTLPVWLVVALVGIVAVMVVLAVTGPRRRPDTDTSGRSSSKGSRRSDRAAGAGPRRDRDGKGRRR